MKKFLKKFHTKFIADFLRVSGAAFACVAFANCSDDKVLGDISRDQDDVKTPLEEAAANQADQVALLEIRGNVEEQGHQEIVRGPKIEISKAEGSNSRFVNNTLFFYLESTLTLKVTGIQEKYEVKLQKEDGSAVERLSGKLFHGNKFLISFTNPYSEDSNGTFGEQKCKLVVLNPDSLEEICKVDFVIFGSKEVGLLKRKGIKKAIDNFGESSNIWSLKENIDVLETCIGQSLEVWKLENPEESTSKLNLRFEGEAGRKKLCWGNGKHCLDVKGNFETVVEILRKHKKIFGKCPKFVLDRSTIDLTKANALNSFRILARLDSGDIEGSVRLFERERDFVLGVDGEDVIPVIDVWNKSCDGMSELLTFLEGVDAEPSLRELNWFQVYHDLVPVLRYATNPQQ